MIHYFKGFVYHVKFPNETSLIIIVSSNSPYIRDSIIYMNVYMSYIHECIYEYIIYRMIEKIYMHV